MKTKFYLLMIFCCLIAGMELRAKEIHYVEVSSEREEDLKIILNHCLLREEVFDKLAAIYAAQIMTESNKQLPIGPIISRLRHTIQTEEVLQQLIEPYEIFSDQEIHQLRQIFENKTFVKFLEQSFPINLSNYQVINNLLKDIIQQDFEESEKSSPKTKAESNTELEILEITKDNFHEKVEESTKPVIIDVYAKWCPPCLIFAETFKDLHQKYKNKCIFAKVDIDTEALLKSYLKVSAYPTTVFMYKGKVISRAVGNMSKKEFETKIHEFLEELE